jgi:hypothetical protein
MMRVWIDIGIAHSARAFSGAKQTITAERNYLSDKGIEV